MLGYSTSSQESESIEDNNLSFKCKYYYDNNIGINPPKINERIQYIKVGICIHNHMNLHVPSIFNYYKFLSTLRYVV